MGVCETGGFASRTRGSGCAGDLSVFLHDYQSQTTLDLFPHSLGKQNIIANKYGKGEFILNEQGCLSKIFRDDPKSCTCELTSSVKII